MNRTKATTTNIGLLDKRYLLLSGQNDPITGDLLIKPTTNSTTTFQIQPSGSTTPTLIVDTTNGKVGIGIATPGDNLDVLGTIRTTLVGDATKFLTLGSNYFRSNGIQNMFVDNAGVGTSINFRVSNATTLDLTAMTILRSGDVTTYGSTLTIQRTSNDVNPPTFIGTKIRAGGVLLNDNLFQLSGYGADNTLVTRHGAYISMSANGTWSTTSSPAIIALATTPVNTISPVVGLTLTAGGQVQINGHTDVLQLRVIGNATQTANLTEWQNSGGTVLSCVNASGKIGIGTTSPTASLTLSQKAGSDGFLFTGNSIGGVSSGTGVFMTLGYNAYGNKQLWIGDSDYAGLSTGYFNRTSVSGGKPLWDVVRGDNAAFGALNLGTSTGSKVVIGDSSLSSTQPGSQLWVNNGMSIGSNYRSSVAPTDGLLIQGNLGIGTTAPNTRLHLAGTTSSHFAQIDTGLNFDQVDVGSTSGRFTVVPIATAGNIDTGNHYYTFAFVTALGVTDTARTIVGPIATDTATAGQTTITIPVSSDYRVTKRRIYRGKAGQGVDYQYLLAEIADNTTVTYIDNKADSTLGTTNAYRQPNTTNSLIQVNGNSVFFADTYGTIIGFNAGYNFKANGGYNSTFLGFQAGYNITTGNRNTLIGGSTGIYLTTETSNVMVGEAAGYYVKSSSNTIIGDYAGFCYPNYLTGGNNTILGSVSGYKLSGTSGYNTLIGTASGYNLTNGDSYNIFLGNYSGNKHTGLNNRLLVDCVNRADMATEQTNSIIYGVMAALPVNQTLALNAGTTITGYGAIVGNADVLQLKVKGNATQTANLQEWQNSSGTVWNSFGLTGAVFNESGDASTDFRVESDTEANMFFLDANADTDGAIYLGGTTNSIKVLKGGTLSLLGTATVWKDIDFPIIVRTTGTGIPTLTTLNGNITMPQWAVNDFNQCESQEFIHEWKQNSTCYFHIHLTTNGLDATNRYVQFEIEFGYVTPNGVWVFPATMNSGDLLIPANTPDKTMFILSIGNFTPTANIGGHVVARLKRVASTGTAPTNNPWVPMLQMHVECDTLGSNDIASK